MDALLVFLIALMGQDGTPDGPGGACPDPALNPVPSIGAEGVPVHCLDDRITVDTLSRARLAEVGARQPATLPEPSHAPVGAP